MNTRDSEVISGLLLANGYAIADALEDADVVIFNTCSVRQHAEDRVWSEIGRVGKLGPPRFRAAAARNLCGGATSPMIEKKIIGLVGCMAQNYKDSAFQRSPYVDFVVGPADIDKIPSIIARLISHDRRPVTGDRGQLLELKIWETDGMVRPGEIYQTGYHAEKDHAYVVISEGCENFCSYCVVPYTRGKLRHRAYTEILREIEEAVASGITKVTLLGQNVNAYVSPVAGRQSPVNFMGLLSLVNGVKGLQEVSFLTSHPKDTAVELFRAMADLEKVKKSLHLPVQSGSDRILQMMNRGYTRKYYLDLVDNYRRMVTGGVLTTDIILGFPTESEADFQDTLDLVKRVEFDAAYIFKYSVRPHTAAANVVDDVPLKEKERRHALVLQAQRAISKRKQGK